MRNLKLKPQLTVIDTIEGIKELQVYLSDKEFIAVDTETTGLTARHEVIGFSVCAEENKAFYIILAKWNNGVLEYNHDPEYQKSVVNILTSIVGKFLIMHNGIFDCMMIESNFKISLINSLHTDTMILAHLLDENRPVGLKPLSIKYFGAESDAEQKEMESSIVANGGSITKDNYELYKGDPYLIGKYGAKDTLLTYKLFYQLVSELYEQGLDKFFYEEESMPLLRGPTYELNTTGLTVDLPKLATLKKTLQAECLEARDFIYSEIQNHVKDKYPGTNKKNSFNIGASQQLGWLLFGHLGLEFGTLTKGGKTVCKALGLRLPYTKVAKRDFIAICSNRAGEIYEPEVIINGKKRKAKKIKEPWAYIASDNKTLVKLAPKIKWLQRLLEYQKKLKLLGTYVVGIETRAQYGVIYPSFLQHGTKTGRYSSKLPNFQNLPRDDKRIKECIIARPGKVFVGADQSQLEPRMFASISADERLCNAFNTGQDPYSVVGIDVYDKLDCTPYKEGKQAFGELHPTLRQDSKTFMLASTYGANGYQLAHKMKKTPDEAQRDIDNYFKKFPKVRKMMIDTHEEVKKNGFVLSYCGRPRRLPDAKNITKLYGNLPHEELPYEARSLLNAAVNYKMQGGGGSIMNRAAIATHNNCKRLGIETKLVVQVHDSLVNECNESDAEIVALVLQDALENTVQLNGVRLEAIPKIGKNLAEV